MMDADIMAIAGISILSFFAGWGLSDFIFSVLL